jgi:predicted nucleotidyltransferase
MTLSATEATCRFPNGIYLKMGNPLLDIRLRSKLASWAKSKPTIKALYVFGSYAKGTAKPSSDLDLALDFVDGIDDELSELIVNAGAWKQELTALTGLLVKDIYLASDQVVGATCFTVFTR